MAQVFISYAKTDRISAESLARQLTDRGFDVWWDFQLYTGDDFHDVIREEIHKAKAVIVIWSEAAVASQWVRGEAQEAFDLKKLVPTHLAGFDPKRVPLNFRALHIESVENFDALVRAIERKGASVRAPKPAAPPRAERTQAAVQSPAAPSGPSRMTPFQMGQMYSQAFNAAYAVGRRANYEEAARLFRILVEHGHVAAHNGLAKLYEGRPGVPENLPEAARLYRLAGDKGYALAYASLGKLYEHGRGVRQDYAEALRLYKLALEGGSSLGAFYVAEMLEKGFGVERNEHEALRHYRLAEELVVREKRVLRALGLKRGGGAWVRGRRRASPERGTTEDAGTT